MTTLSTHSHLSSSLTQTERSHAHALTHVRAHDQEIGGTKTNVDTCVDNCDDGNVEGSHDSGDLLFEDEDTASVEADGTSEMHVRDDGGTAEEHLLTAALVTSIVEVGGAPAGDASTINPAVPRIRRMSLLNIQASDSSQNSEEIAAQVSFPHVNVTPPASASSSCSSADYTPKPTRQNPELNRSYTVGVRKLTSPEEVAFVIAPPNRTCKEVKVSQPETKKRKMNLNGGSIVEFSNLLELAMGKSPVTLPSKSVPASSPQLSTGTAVENCCQQPPTANDPKHSDFAKKKVEVLPNSIHLSKKMSFLKPSALNDEVHKRSNTRLPPMNSEMESVLNPSLVPNPLAVLQDSAFHLHSSARPFLTSKSTEISIKTNTLMAAVPEALVSGGSAASINVSTQLVGQLSNIAENSISIQHYHTDWLAASCVSGILPPGRGRIFSIDLDPAVLDFVENVVDPLTTTGESPGSCDKAGVAFNADETLRVGLDNIPGRLPSRDRGFSFEFFSFGISEDELLSPDPVTKCRPHTCQEKRQRGDSIIFDPNSFREGGIHETSALLHIKQENGQSAKSILRTSEPHNIVSRPPYCNQTSDADLSSSKLPSLHSSKSCLFTEAETRTSSCVSPVHEKLSFLMKPCPKVKYSPPSGPSELDKSKLSAYAEVIAKSPPQTIPQAFSDNTIHMPHGSDAAAAAAAGMAQTSPTALHDGFSLSHTACPMELLNEGGRIGIYLPEERKSRIAKFHSKRKIRIWRKRIKYDCRKKLADSRPRIKGRFVKRSDVSGDTLA